jgi:phosphatidylserine decarboxylase
MSVGHARLRRPRLIAQGVPAWLWTCWGAGLVVAVAPTPARLRGARLAAAASTTVCAAFFRDPERDAGGAEIVAPADGRITAVDRRADGRWRVAIYMSLRDVHVNRAPVTATVVALEHRPGAHRPAFRKDSERNERLHWTFATALGPLELTQIAGVLARRIVPYRSPGDAVLCGDRIGLIRFGSRVDVVLPRGVRPDVAVGDRVRAGTSSLASNAGRRIASVSGVGSNRGAGAC